MTTRVKALYDFTGEPNTSEISIEAGEVLILTRTDVGEGWWEGTNVRGQTGLFPEAYVEIYVETQPPAMAPPINPMLVQPPAYQQQTSQPSQQAPPQPRYDQTEDYNEMQDEWEDDWDDDNDTYSEVGPPAANANNQTSQNYYQNNQQSNYKNVQLPLPPTDDNSSLQSYSAATKLKKSGMFSKIGDSYILGTTTISVPDQERIYIIHQDNGYFYKTIRDVYTVRVASPKKETKFKGIKSFIAYQLTPSFNNISVSRRYKHFDWLHGRLVDKFCLIPIPPLPDKQISGRYDDQFVEHRRVQLQEFIDWVCRHPVLSTCEVFMHFLTCTDDKKWKPGKRQAERDQLVGPAYCAAIFPPEKQLLQSQVDSQLDNCNQFVHMMDNAVKNLLIISNEQAKRFQVTWKKDFQRIGEGFSELARALEIDERRAITNVNLSNSVGQAAGVFIGIGQLIGEQPKHDFIPFADCLHIYRGILGDFPDVLNVHKGAMNKRKECERLTSEQKMGNAQLQEVNRRTDIMSYAVLAEMNHFRQERDVHLKMAMKHFIQEQITFYQEIITRLQTAQRFFE
ncbi:sorting nexin lst-4 [Contarinia nasturtii]|uniref:sorting nexin lst-4 n=1 Tax=Contarinia nasturtii TaxID=265458 RepID=UPI0012D3BB0D|nr:sorting nexin lst-4 [Contarinia nasturtii]XP_031641116.1 sorting nexin lst-4 [Contarinia nasturtii]XP_031641117.1 sorting nexin lst-4 [Contarinia nasturtii]